MKLEAPMSLTYREAEERCCQILGFQANSFAYTETERGGRLSMVEARQALLTERKP